MTKFDKEGLESFHKAGSMVLKLRGEVPSLVRPGRPALEICEVVQARLRAVGRKPAFAVGIGINDVAAHYPSPRGDKLAIPASSIVKVDFGIHLKGYVTDTAVSVCLEPAYEPLVHAADEALTNAIHAFRPGVKLSEVGRIIQSTIARYGYRPIRNLTGHSIDRYSVHAGKSVPNVGEFNGTRIIEGEVYAIEPFVTFADAKGSVRDDSHAYIYRFVKTKGVRKEHRTKFLSSLMERLQHLPFHD